LEASKDEFRNNASKFFRADGSPALPGVAGSGGAMMKRNMKDIENQILPSRNPSQDQVKIEENEHEAEDCSPKYPSS